jgi:hypothetical protein
VDELILLPAKPAVAASKLYTIADELLVAVVDVVIVAAPWQRVDVAGANGFMLTVGVVVITIEVVAGPLHPAALAVTVDVPLHPAA